MRRTFGPALLMAALLLCDVAFAKDKKKDAEEDEEEELAKPEEQIDESVFHEAGEDEEVPPETAPPPPPPSDEPEAPEPEDLDFQDTQDEKIDFKDDDEQQTMTPRSPGEDTAMLYRAHQKAVSEMNPDEELISWEQYLAKYPKTLFRDRIDERMEDLSQNMFQDRVPGSDIGKRPVDAEQRELNFATPLHLQPLDARSKIDAGVEWGIPNWLLFHADFEYAFLRELSAHAGIVRDFTGYRIVLGPKYNIVKSSRTGTLIGVNLDLALNTAPFFPLIRPTVGIGQRIRVMEGLDLALQFAPDLELRDPFAVRWQGGIHGELRPNETVFVWWEATANLKYLNSDSPFAFNVASFGLKFVPGKKKDEQGKGRAIVGLGANIPYMYSYWGFFRGAVSADMDYYL